MEAYLPIVYFASTQVLNFQQSRLHFFRDRIGLFFDAIAEFGLPIQPNLPYRSLKPNADAVLPSPKEKNAYDRPSAWNEWVAGHQPRPVIADDSRESIYAGRGE